MDSENTNEKEEGYGNCSRAGMTRILREQTIVGTAACAKREGAAAVRYILE